MLTKAYLDYLRYERNYSDCTLTAYKKDLKEFEEFFRAEDEQLEWETIDADIVRRWMVKLMNGGRATTTVNRKLSSLRSFYKFLRARNTVTRDFFVKVKGPKNNKPLPSFVKEADMNKLLDEVDFGEGFAACRDKMVIEMFYATGMRLAELIGMNDKDIDFSAGQVKVTGKRDKQRLIPFGEELRHSMTTYLSMRNETIPRLTDAFFVNDKGKRIARSKVSNLVKNALSKVVGLKKRSPHVLRHTFATSMLNNHAELNVVKELLGHESLATTEIYTHTTFEELKEVYKLAHPRA